MDERLQQTLDNVPEDEPRSRLEPYRLWILRWRRQGRTYHRIRKILADECNVKVAYATLHEFVQRRSRPRKAEPALEPEPVTTPLAAAPIPQAGVSGDRWAAERQRMRRHKETPYAPPAQAQKLFEYTDEDSVKPL